MMGNNVINHNKYNIGNNSNLMSTNSSKVTKANTGNSLRTTIPLKVAKELGIGVGDILIWSHSIEKENDTINVKKVEI